MDVPGQSGWTVTGDKTVEFARFPLDFIKKRIEKYNSNIFLSRVLNKPTIFVTSNQGVKEILIEKESSFRMGYKDFGYMQALYGDIFLFEDDEEAYKVRSFVRELFHGENCNHYMETVIKLTEEKLNSLDHKHREVKIMYDVPQKRVLSKDFNVHIQIELCSEAAVKRSSVDVYEVFKDLSTAICLSIFLDIDTHEEYELVREITKTHWHGLISVPLNLKVKGWASSYNKADEARNHLINLILNKLRSENNGRFLQQVVDAGFKDEMTAATHVLLFVSAIIPKAFSSLITSFVLETAGEFMVGSIEQIFVAFHRKKVLSKDVNVKIQEGVRENALEDENVFKDILLEIQRLWPPLYGGRRFTVEEVTIDGYKIPADHCVAYISRYANRDSKVFQQAEQFLPDRWKNEDADKRHLVWTFGAGTRSCIGIHFINSLLTVSDKRDDLLGNDVFHDVDVKVQHIGQYLLKTYDWSLEGEDNPIYKTLPVARPKDPVLFTFTRK